MLSATCRAAWFPRAVAGGVNQSKSAPFRENVHKLVMPDVTRRCANFVNIRAYIVEESIYWSRRRQGSPLVGPQFVAHAGTVHRACLDQRLR
jgi:hypothetical protein